MIVNIVLDSEPLGLLTQRLGAPKADLCRSWMAAKIGQGTRIALPEIIDYELRRELLRAGKHDSVARLDAFALNSFVTYLPLDSSTMRAAAQLWADVRQQGLPTAPNNHLDVDVILAAQALKMGLNPSQFVVATGNVGHLSRLVPAEQWQNI